MGKNHCQTDLLLCSQERRREVLGTLPPNRRSYPKVPKVTATEVNLSLVMTQLGVVVAVLVWEGRCACKLSSAAK